MLSLLRIQFFCPWPCQTASQSHIPFGLLFNFQGTMKRSFTYSHWVNSNSNPKRKNICELKKLFTHLDKGCRNAHPFSGFLQKFFEKIYLFTCSHWEVPNYRVFLKKFLSGKKPSHLFGIAKPNDTLFHRKNEKIFLLGWGWLYFLAEKAPSLIPTGDG
ncbi:hypothetical protein B5F08_08515 [Anaeromassilibacillus sp. An172]|nr:hypothetical protein B5F08_08515 [Anaeromassilibacillus sp. An172]